MRTVFFSQVKQSVKKQRDPKLAERFEKRLTDELYKIFDDSDSFYYSRTLDLTNTLQRQYEIEKILEAEEGVGKPVVDITKWWKHVDDRFFWNKHMLKDIIALGVSGIFYGLVSRVLFRCPITFDRFV